MAGREEAVGRLIVRALTKPVNVLAGAAVCAVGIATGLWPLVIGGIVIYGVLAATTLRNPDDARRALGRPRRAEAPAVEAVDTRAIVDPEVRARLEEAQAEYVRILVAVEESPVPLPEVRVETTGLMDDLVRLCRRAQSVRGYLASVDEDRLRAQRDDAHRELADAPADLRPALTETVAALDQQLETVREMRGRMRAFDARMRQLTSGLGAIRGEVATLAVESEHDSAERIVGQVQSARELVTGLTSTLTAADERRPRPGGAPG